MAIEQNANTGVQSIHRAASILDAVAEGAVSGTNLTQIARLSCLTKATAHRILKTLIASGLVDQDAENGLYFPGIKLVALSATASNRFGLARQSREGRARIAERTGDTVFLSLRVGANVICVARTEGAFPIKTLTLDVGEVRPLGVGAGSLAILAFLRDDERRKMLDASSGDFAAFGTSITEIADEAYQALEAGFALDDGRIIPGITGIGVPICSDNGDPIASISVAAISDRLKGSRRENVLRWLSEEASRLEAELAPLLSARSAAGRVDILAKR